MGKEVLECVRNHKGADKMKQIAVVSGKGGTGKTTIAASLGFLTDSCLLADCDVDASNLYLLFDPKIAERFQYRVSKKAVIDESKCNKCGICEKVCRFDAVRYIDGSYSVDPYACEGCNACVISCKNGAIRLFVSQTGEYFKSITSENKPLAHARLEPGEENSGGLVAEVRKLSFETAKDIGEDFVIIDGAPGIGCPAISSISGVSYVVVVTEPSLSALHDLKRTIETARYFRRECGVIINKFDLNLEITDRIKKYCLSEGIELLGKVPFDEMVEKSVLESVPVVKFPESKAAKAIVNIHGKLVNILKNKRGE